MSQAALFSAVWKLMRRKRSPELVRMWLWPARAAAIQILRTTTYGSPCPCPSACFLQLVVAWRPLWHLLQSQMLSHINPASRASEVIVDAHLKALTGLIRRASRYFSPSAASEIAAAFTPSLARVGTHATAAVAALWLFLPRGPRLSNLPAATISHWLRVWAWVDECTEWDACWFDIFARLAHPARIAAAGLEWGASLPFFFARLQSVLSVPVAGGRPNGSNLPHTADPLLAGAGPNAMHAACKLIVRLLTVPVPDAHRAAYGDPLPRGSDAGKLKTGDGSSHVGDATAVGHVERMLRALSSFFYPTAGRAQASYISLLRALSSRVARRLGRETGEAQAGVQPLPSGHVSPPLGRATVVRFVDAVLPLAVLGLYAGADGRSAVADAAYCLRVLAVVAPARVTRAIVGMASRALDAGTVNQTHQAPNALEALHVLVRPLLYPVPHIAPALPSLAMAALPGIDPNDASKTSSALRFYVAMLLSVPIVDPADADGEGETPAGSWARLPAWHAASPSYSPLPRAGGAGAGARISAAGLGGAVGAYGPADTVRALRADDAEANGGEVDAPGSSGHECDDDASPSETGGSDFDADMDGDVDRGASVALVPEGVSAPTRALFAAARTAGESLSEWALLFLDRVFALLEAREKPAKVRRDRAAADAISSWLAWALNLLFSQLSRTVLASAVARVYAWHASASVLDARKDVEMLLSVLANAAPSVVVARFVPLHVRAALAPGVSDASFVWHTSMLKALVCELGTALLPVLPGIRAVIAAAFARDEKQPRKAGGKLLRAALGSLVNVYSMGKLASVNPAEAATPGRLWLRWGTPVSLVDDQRLVATLGGSAALVDAALPPRVAVLWHIPSDAERAGAVALLNEFLVPSMARLRALAATHGNSSSNGSAAAALSVPQSEMARIRVDLELVRAALRGAIGVLTDSCGPEGDDAVIATGGTGSKALAWDAATNTIEFATAVGGASLRAELTLVLSAYMHASAAHVDLSRDTVAIGLANKIAFRLLAGRGARMSKAAAAVNGVRKTKREMRSTYERSRMRAIVRAVTTTGTHEGAASAAAISTAGLALNAPRAIIVSRVHAHYQRRLGEAVYAVPRALHARSVSAAIGDSAPDDAVDDDDARGDAGGTPLADDAAAAMVDEDADEAADYDPAPSPVAAAGADAVTDELPAQPSETEPFPRAELPASPRVDVQGAITVFGRRALARLAPAEAPYALLLAALARGSTHTYEKARRSSQVHLASGLAVYAWLRRPAAISAMRRLENLTAAATGVAAIAQVPSFRAATEAYLAARSVPPSPSVEQGATSLPPPSLVSTSGKESLSLLRLARGAGNDDVGASPLLTASAQAGAAVTDALSLASVAYTDVLGALYIGFLLAPHAVASDAALLERGITLLLRSGALVALLPLERQAHVSEALTITAVTILRGWQALPAPPASPSGSTLVDVPKERAAVVRRAAAKRASVARLLRVLITQACPDASVDEWTPVSVADAVAATPLPSSSPVTPATPSSTPMPGASDIISATHAVPPDFAAALAQPAHGRRLVPNADGSRSASAAPVQPGSLHWRFELLALVWATALLPPARPAPLRLLIDAALPEATLAACPRDGGGAAAAPEAAWLWVLNAALSEFVPLRSRAVEMLTTLLLARRDSVGAGLAVPSLPRVTVALADPQFVSQLIMAISNDHAAALAAAGNEGGGGGAGMRAALGGGGAGLHEMLKLSSSPFCLEVSRQHMRGGALPTLPHMALFECLAVVFPDIVPPSLAALESLVAPSAGHELATLRVRQATFAEAVGGFLRAASLNLALVTAALGDASPSQWQPTDANISELRRHFHPAFGPMIDVIASVAPTLDIIGPDSVADFYNAFRFAARGRDPRCLAPLAYYLCASAMGSLAPAQELLPPQALAAVGGPAFMRLIRIASGGHTASLSPMVSTAPSTSFAAQSKWLQLVGAVVDEALVAPDGPRDPSGAVPGVRANDVEAAEAPALVVLDSAMAVGGARVAATTLARSLLPLLLGALAHPYKACRGAVAALLSVVLEASWEVTLAADVSAMPKGSNDVIEPRSQWAPAIVATILVLADAALVSSRGTNGAALTDSPSGGPEIPAATGAPAVGWDVHALDTTFQFLHALGGGDGVAVAPTQLALLPPLLAAQQHPDRDVAGVAGAVLASTSQNLTVSPRCDVRDAAAEARFVADVRALAATCRGGVDSEEAATHVESDQKVAMAGDFADALLTALRAAAGPARGSTTAMQSVPSSSAVATWSARRAALNFLVPVRAHALLLLPTLVDGALLQLVRDALDDPQVEVVDTAADVLVGFAVTLPQHAQAALVDSFLRRAGTPLPRKVAPPMEGESADSVEAVNYRGYRASLAAALRARHTGVLGAAAVIRAHPFDVPPWLPSALAALSRRAADAAPVGAATRRLFGDFKRTHADNWEAQKRLFSVEQLAEVAEVSGGSNYFA